MQKDFREKVENNGLDEELFELIVSKNWYCNFHRFLEMNLCYLEEGMARIETKVKEEFLNPSEICHGGVGFSLLDAAMGASARTVGKEISTVEMSINYFKPALEGEYLRGVGRVIKDGRRIMVCEGELYNQENELLAKAKETFYVIEELFA